MSRRRVVSADERRLWFAAMHGAEPLAGRRLPREVSLIDKPLSDPAEPVSVAPAAAAPSSRSPAPPSRGGLRPGEDAALQARDLDRRTAERFRRGRMDIAGRIDLHGMTQAQAHGALAAFVHRAWAESRRCVLVITGKGGASGAGVLRQAAPRWLAEPVLARMILAVEPAVQKDGGDGAFYVLIRRRRERRG